MGELSHQSRVVPVHDLRDYFRTSIDDIIARQGVDLDLLLRELRLRYLISVRVEVAFDGRDSCGA